MTTARRGMTMIELMIALTITVIITAGLAGMVSAVSAGVMTTRDTREVMVRAAVAQARLDSYVAPARSILAAEPSRLVLWLNDGRQSKTVHLSEVRWLTYDAAGDRLIIQLVEFLDENEALTGDEEFSTLSAAAWESQRQQLFTTSRLRTIPLVDGVESVEISTDTPAPSAKRVTFTLSFMTTAEPATVPVSAAILLPRPPTGP